MEERAEDNVERIYVTEQPGDLVAKFTLEYLARFSEHFDRLSEYLGVDAELAQQVALGLLFLRLESIWLAHVGADELKAVGVALIVVGLLFLIPNLKILFDHRLELVTQKDL